MLELSSVVSRYGAAQILFDVDLRVKASGVTCILGHNGAGKTTLLRTIMGLMYRPSGRIVFEGRDIIGLRPHQIARAGIGHVPEDRRVFTELTVQENLDVAVRATDQRNAWTIERAYEVFPALKEFRNRLAGRLSGGQQQMLTMARTLVGNPSLLLLDEPTEGLSPLLVETLEEQIIGLKRSNLAILLACQDIGFAMRLADQFYVMNGGKIVFQSTASEVSANPHVLQSHLEL